MTQLILDTEGYNITLPESQHKGYECYRDDLSVDVEMVTGRMVRELRGTVWKIKYQYGFFTDEDKQNLLKALEKGRGQSITCSFLPPDSNDLSESTFFVTDIDYPKFFWSRDGSPLWGDFSFELREVAPSD